MLETPTASVVSIEALVRDLDVLIRARYPLVSVATFEEGRVRRLMRAVAGLDRHKPKGLFVWSRTQGLRQVAGPNLGVGERPIPGVEDPISILEHIAQSESCLYILCDFGAYLVPDGLPDPPLVRQLRELAWAIKARPVTVLFVGPTFPDIPALEKEVKTIDLPLPDEREVAAILDLQLDRLGNLPDVRLEVSVHTREQLVSALLGLTETEIENALAKAAITRRGIDTDAIPLILDEKRSVIRQTGALTYSHPESADHLGGYAHLRGLLHEAAATFSPAARAFGVEPHKGLLLVGLPGCGKDLCAKVAASVLGRPLLNLDMAAVMGEGGGIIGSAATSIRRALSIATTLKGILGLSEFEKGMGGLHSSARSDGGETARTIGFLLNWMQEQQIVFVDLPSPEDRAAIFRVHLARRARDPEAFQLEELAAASDGFSGAEIEAAVKSALLDGYLDGARQLTTADVLRRVRSIRPTSEVKREDIVDLRRWAQEHLAIDAVRGETASGERLLEF